MSSKRLIPLSIALLLQTPVMAADTVYCPQNSGYIKTGMTQSQVIAACGQPITKEKSNTPVTQKVPVQQLIYTTLNRGSGYPGLYPTIYDQWSLPSGSTRTPLTVDIVNGKVSTITISGSSTNAMSICGGTNVSVGADVGQVYSACGSPSMVNNTYINQVVPSNTKPEVWVYQVDQYQAPISLTFVNGKLQSIN